MGGPAEHWSEADWDQLQLGETILPGLWDVEGAAERRIDVKPQKGQDGVVVKDEGYESAKLSLIGRMTTKDEFKKLQAAIEEIHPRRRGTALAPIKLTHPAATVIGVDMVYVTSVGAPRIANGVLEIRIEVLEWLQPKKIGKKAGPAVVNHEIITLAEARRSVAGDIYGTPYGFDRVETGYESPSEQIEKLEISPNVSFADVQPLP